MSTTPPNPDEASAAMAGALMGLNAVFDSVVDAVTGHRAKLLEKGFSETAAEAMSVAYHAAVMQAIAAGVAKNVSKPSPPRRFGGG